MAKILILIPSEMNWYFQILNPSPRLTLNLLDFEKKEVKAFLTKQQQYCKSNMLAFY